jgi:hypothetical protein
MLTASRSRYRTGEVDMVRSTVAHAVVLAVAAVVGCAPTPAEQEAMMMPVLDNGSFSAELGGCAIHYEVHGQGPVVMAVPNSWGLSLDGLRGLYRRLEDDLTMVYFDPRGMGGSWGWRQCGRTSMHCGGTYDWRP